MTGLRPIGLVLLLGGFFGAAFVAVRHSDSEELVWNTIEWGWYGVTFLVGAAGVVILRVTAHGAGTQAHKLDADLAAMHDSLGGLVSTLRTMNAQRESIDVYDVHKRIDAELVETLGRFVEARESMIHLYGLQPYADVMNDFAGSERNINRAWSASADGYIDEVWICLGHAERLMSAAQTRLESYRSHAATAL